VSDKDAPFARPAGGGHRSPTREIDQLEQLNQWRALCPPLLDYIRARLGSKKDVLDIAQDTYLRLLLLEDPSSIRGFSEFAFQIAKNLTTDRLRMHARHHLLNEQLAIERPLMLGTEDSRTPERIYEAQSEIDAMMRALQGLPRQVKEVFEAYIGGEAAGVIAKRERIHVRMVYRHIARAHQYLAAARHLRVWRTQR
jgi:RNA polymerase sigma factor (sigma-70 family)